MDQVQGIIKNYLALAVPKASALEFITHLTASRDAWFVESGPVGLIYLTNIDLDRDADFNAVFWDQRLTEDRMSAVRWFLGEAFTKFRLPRISCQVPYSNAPMRRFLRETGFTLEGVTRKGWTVSPPDDLVHFGMLQEESPWQHLHPSSLV